MKLTSKIHKMKFAHEIDLMLIALTFLTRIPISKSINFSSEKLNQAGRYFSLVGLLVGILCATVFLLANVFLSEAISIIVSMMFSILVTGSFHEDGLADTCDGFGGGWGVEQKLNIMKDSRIGTYGAVALWFALSLKFQLLTEVLSVIIALIVAHPLSRSFSTCMIYFLPYVTNENQSKVKPLAENLRFSDLLINLAIGVMPLFLISQLPVTNIICLLLGLFLTFIVLRIFYIKQIGGFTGDALGASQQISELFIYIILVALI